MKRIIDSVVSARDVTTELIVQYVRAMESASGRQDQNAAPAGGGGGGGTGIPCGPDSLCGNVPLRELKLKAGVLIAGIVRRDGEIVIPGGNDIIRSRRRCDRGDPGHRPSGASRYSAAGVRG